MWKVVNNSNNDMKLIWHVKKINVIRLKCLYPLIFKILDQNVSKFQTWTT